MTTTSELFQPGHRRGPTSTIRLAGAYEAVFLLRNAGKEDLDLVMADLAEFSGYFAVSPPGTSAEELLDANGRRAVFARILSLIRLPMGELTRLRDAALIEMQISSQEGDR